MAGLNADGLAVEAELSDGSHVKCYSSTGRYTILINGQLVKAQKGTIAWSILEIIEDALDDFKNIKLDMSYPEYLNWVPGNYDQAKLKDQIKNWRELNGYQTESPVDEL